MLKWCVGLAAFVALVENTAAQVGSFLASSKRQPVPAPVALDSVEPSVRDDVRAVLQHPTLASLGPSETFPCKPSHYFFFLEHPDRAVLAWRRLGAKCVSIVDRGDGRFGWSDDNGSDVVWQTIYRGPDKCIWFAQGKVRPGPLLPLVPVRVILVLNYAEKQSTTGASLIQHRADVYLRTDSKATAMLTRMMGTSAQRLAEQSLGQLQMFFSSLCYYMDRHPQSVETLLRPGD